MRYLITFKYNLNNISYPNILDIQIYYWMKFT